MKDFFLWLYDCAHFQPFGFWELCHLEKREIRAVLSTPWGVCCLALYLVVFVSGLLALPIVTGGNPLRLVGEIVILFICLPAAMYWLYQLPYDLADAFQNGFALPFEEEEESQQN